MIFCSFEDSKATVKGFQKKHPHHLMGEGQFGYRKPKLTGFLDLQGGDSKYSIYNAKMQESTHIFICDYVELDAKAENSRMVVNGGRYDIMLIDDPMGLHKHLEIFLKFTRGQ